MAKVSPIVRALNAGEFSRLMDGRTDLSRYPASLRSLVNFMITPQGPVIARSGTGFVAPAFRDASSSRLVPFVFSASQAKVLEFTGDRVRFLDEDGLQVYTSVTATVTSNALQPIVVNAVGLGASVGDQVVLSGFPDSYNLNGEVTSVTVKAGNDYTLELSYPNKTVVSGSAARVYHVACSYPPSELQALRALQSVDVLYLFTGGRPRTLSRYGDYDWRLENISFADGPYLPVNDTPTVLAPGTTGNAVPDMASDTLPSGACSGSGNRPAIVGTRAAPVDFLERQIGYSLDASQYYFAFDDDNETYWASDSDQSGTVEYAPASAFVCDGYTLHMARDNQDTSYLAKDYAPSTFTFEGYDGTDWTVLDRQDDYVLYDGGKSGFFQISNDTSYQSYRINITKVTRNGLIEPRIKRLVLRNKNSLAIAMTASSTEGVNGGQGFLASDVGRLLRLKGSDNAWRWCEITAVASTTSFAVELKGEPLPDNDGVKDWRLGYWSDATGWPVTGAFFEDRLWLAGPSGYPDQFAASVSGAYTTFKQTDDFGEVLDDSAIVGRLNSRKLSGIQWLSSDSRGMLLGTGSEEYSIFAPNKEAVTARNIKARPATRRGSAAVEPVRIDNQILYVQSSKRTIREFAYVFESDGYKSPSMSQLASHIGVKRFEELEYAAEPYGMVWVRRGDGSLVCLTYDREQDVVGWHRHDMSGARVESITVIPQKDQLQDALWLQVVRTVNGVEKRYIERLMPLWDFGTSLDEAHFVDSGLRYNGTTTDVIYGLQHLEGETVYGLADHKPIGPLVVAGGSVTLPYEAGNIVLGLGFDSEAETSRLENGALEGTAQGKNKRMHRFVAGVWDSATGEIGVYDSEVGGPVYEPIEYVGDFDQFEDIELFSGFVGPFRPTPGYNKEGVLFFKRDRASPLPFNLTAIMPQIDTQDG